MRITGADVRATSWRGTGESKEILAWDLIVFAEDVPTERFKTYDVLDLTELYANDNTRRPPLGHQEVFWATDGIFVQYLYHDSTNEHGYGGDVFDLFVRRYFRLDADGDIKATHEEEYWTAPAWWKVKGPWSSRAGVMNHYAHRFPWLGWFDIVDVTVRKQSDLYYEYDTNYHMAIHREWAEFIVWKYLRDRFELVSDEYKESDGEYTEPTWILKEVK